MALEMFELGVCEDEFAQMEVVVYDQHAGHGWNHLLSEGDEIHYKGKM